MGFEYARDIPYEEKMLWANVLRRAVFDYALYKGVRSHRLEWQRACQYVFTVGLRYEDGVSFEEVCELFNWDPNWIRRLVTKLTRADIKKMETTQFREDFVFDVVQAVVENTERWKTSNFAAPFLPLYHYNAEYREKMKPRTVYRESILQTSAPIVQWQAMA